MRQHKPGTCRRCSPIVCSACGQGFLEKVAIDGSKALDREWLGSSFDPESIASHRRLRMKVFCQSPCWVMSAMTPPLMLTMHASTRSNERCEVCFIQAVGLEPTRVSPAHFECAASTNSATPARGLVGCYTLEARHQQGTDSPSGGVSSVALARRIPAISTQGRHGPSLRPGRSWS